MWPDSFRIILSYDSKWLVEGKGLLIAFGLDGITVADLESRTAYKAGTTTHYILFHRRRSTVKRDIDTSA